MPRQRRSKRRESEKELQALKGIDYPRKGEGKEKTSPILKAKAHRTKKKKEKQCLIYQGVRKRTGGGDGVEMNHGKIKKKHNETEGRTGEASNNKKVK